MGTVFNGLIVPSGSTALVTWTSDVAADSTVAYGLGTYPSATVGTVRNGAFVTSHSITLSGLTNGQLYWAQISSVDGIGDPLGYSGNLAPAGVLQFTAALAPPSPPSALVSREAIYQALFALASEATQAVTASRSLRPLDDVPDANMPALYQHQVTETRTQDKGEPFILKMQVDLYFYASTQSPNIQNDEEGNSAASQLNSMLDNLDAALAPDPVTMVQTLGGLVSHCWISGNTTYFEDTLGQKAALVVGVEMLVQQASSDGYSFDAGSIYMIDRRAGADATPQLVGGMNEINATVEFDNNVERGTFQHDFKVMRKAQRIKCTAKFAQIKGAVLAQLLYGQTLSAGSQAVVTGQSATIAETVIVTPPSSGTFSLDLGCIFDDTAQALTLITVGTPTTGQYKVSAGTYTFAAADVGRPVLISYRYAVTTGVSLVLNNQRSGYAPEFLVVLNTDGNGKNVTWTLNACYSDQLSFVTKIEDFTVPEFSFTAKADASNVIGTFSYSQ